MYMKNTLVFATCPVTLEMTVALKDGAAYLWCIRGQSLHGSDSVVQQTKTNLKWD